MPRVHRVAVACLATVGIAACAGGTTGAAPPGPTSAAPRPVRTVIRTTHVLHTGQGVRLDAQRGVALRLVANGPTVSRTSLSSSHGYPPARGYYVTFRVTIVNVGSRAIGVGPGDFAVVVGGRKLT